MEAERELYGPIIDLFKNHFFIASEVPLGPKRIDIVAERDEKIIAIEVKVNKWKKAFRQALNYQLGADESYVALPQEYSKPVNQEIFRASGIGLITVEKGGKAIVIIPARQSTKKSRNYSTLIKAHLAEIRQKQKESNNPPRNTDLPFKIYLWYLANERKYFDSMPQYYDGFIVSAHVLGHLTAAFTALCAKLNKPFFVLPDTHAFQLAPVSHFLDTKGEIKTSWDKLAKSYGHLINLILLQGRNLQPEDFLSKQGLWEQTLYDLVSNVINFQKEQVSLALSGLVRFLEEPQMKQSNCLVAPYFFFSSINDPWYQISLKMAQESAKHKGNYRLFAVLCASKSILLSDQAITRIPKDFSFPELDGILLWIQDFDEEDEPTPLLNGFKKLIVSLKEIRKEIINLHGKYFSLMLCHFGLDGLGTGVCYKETADPTHFPTGGPPGGPSPKYYIPEIKVKRGKIEAALAIQQLPSLRCNCDICNQELDYMMDGATPNSISNDLMKRHFLINKRNENEHLCTMSLKQAVSEIRAAYHHYEKNADIVPIEHLKRWAEVLTKD